VSFAVEIKGVHKTFGNIQALRGVDLNVPTGSTFGLVGPNGAGKTTLFSIVAGFLRPTSGQIVVMGEAASDETLQGQLSVLPQDATWRKGIPIGKQMAICARLQGMDPNQAQQEVSRVLELTGMQDSINRSPDKLSHGMAKRVAIAQTLIGDPQVVMLDEPLAGLDPAQARRVRLIIQQAAGKRTFIISSHVMADIEALCTDVAIIKAGQIVAQPSMAELTHREAVAVFTLSETPPEGLAASFEALDYVSKAVARTVEKKLQLTVRTDQKSLDEAMAAFIGILMEKKIAFVSVHKGTSLEDAVLEMT
jgi:ABC-2 type transport system ATP-binding protein